MLLIDGLERALLFEMHTADGRVFWCPPGGGLEAGETHEEAAVRELREETGWDAPVIGPVIGERRQVVTWNDGVTYDCAEVWFLARVDALDVDTSSWTDDERIDMGAHRWWTARGAGGHDGRAHAERPRRAGAQHPRRRAARRAVAARPLTPHRGWVRSANPADAGSTLQIGPDAGPNLGVTSG